MLLLWKQVHLDNVEDAEVILTRMLPHFNWILENQLRCIYSAQS